MKIEKTHCDFCSKDITPHGFPTFKFKSSDFDNCGVQLHNGSSDKMIFARDVCPECYEKTYNLIYDNLVKQK